MTAKQLKRKRAQIRRAIQLLKLKVGKNEREANELDYNDRLAILQLETDLAELNETKPEPERAILQFNNLLNQQQSWQL